MKTQKLNTKNKLYTPSSGTTVYIDYSESAKILEVEFIKGKIYHYLEVDKKIWEEYKSIVNSGKSSGVFVNSFIKPRFKYKEIT